MINGLELGDFKAFRSQRIELKPLTILVGENNSGKSSVIAAIRLLAQTVQSADLSVPLLFDGAFGDFGSFRDVVHGNHRGRPMHLGLTVPITRRVQGAERPRSGSASFLSEFKYRTQRRETVLRSTRISAEGRSLITVGRSDDGDRPVLTQIGSTTVPSANRAQLSQLVRMYNFLPQLRPVEIVFRNTSRSESVAENLDSLARIERPAQQATNSVMSALRSVEVIGAMRQPPNRTYLHSGSVSQRIGAAGENWGGIVALAVSGRAKDPLMSEVTAWISKAGIASDIQVSWLSDRHFEVLVEHPVTGEQENIADVGRGTSQVLPVIIGGYKLDSGDTYLVEEPEIHLHPRAQATLGDYFVELTKRGVQSIVETHSEYLILRLQQHVASGELDPAQVVFYYVGLDEKNEKTLTRLTLNAQAIFEESIPGGFFPQRLTEAQSLARARGKSARQ